MANTATIEQLGAIDNATENNLIVALPGSGKSFTLVEMAVAIFSKYPNATITFVTFTKLATKEMRDKLKSKLTAKQLKQCIISTFHSLFLNQAKPHLKGTLLIGSSHSAMVIRAIKATGIKIKFDEAASIIDEEGRILRDNDDIGNSDVELYKAYMKLLKDNKKYDFNDVTKMVCRGLAENSEDSSKGIAPVSSDYILIDEAQDMDELQSKWVYYHGKAGKKITLVGDDDQQIYSWRGANGYEAMVNFRDENDAQTHILSTCFRCTPDILGVAQALIERNKVRIPKTMESKKQGGIDDVNIYDKETKLHQYEELTGLIKKNPLDWVVLARTNKSLQECEAYLSTQGISTTINSGKSFWDNPRANSFLKMLYSIRYTHDIKYLNEVLGYLHEDEEAINDIIFRSEKHKGFHKIKKREAGMWACSTIGFKEIIDEAHNTKNLTVIESRFDKILKVIQRIYPKKKTKPGEEVGKTIEEHVVYLCEKTKGDWYSILESVTRQLDVIAGDKNKGEKEDVLLTTFHGSKGLEWDNVAIIDLTYEQMPSKQTRALKTLYPKEYARAIEEERRLLFVGMTRAGKKLHLFSYGGEEKTSPFLSEVKESAGLEA